MRKLFGTSLKLRAIDLAGSQLLVIAFLLTAVGLAGCGSDETGGGERGRRGSGGMFGGMESQMSAAIPVQVAQVRRGEISTFLLQTTTIEAERQVDILAKVAGLAVKQPVEEGVKVREGDLLVQLDEAELQIDFIQTKVRMDTDKATLDRARNMLEKNLIAEENYETTRLQYESSKAAHEASRLKLEYTSVRSPIDGVVTVRHVELGQRVNVNQSLFQVADFNPLRARIYVPEKDMGRIFEGQRAKITVESESGSEFAGVVKMISPIVDPTSGTAKVTIDIEDDRGKLKPGMFASVFITTETHSDALLIPKKALILESDVDQVYTYQEGSAHKVNLTLGFTSGENVEVLSGLQEGDLVVTAGQEGLREGLPIRIPGQETEMTASMADSAGRPAMAVNSPSAMHGADGQSGRMPGTQGNPSEQMGSRGGDRGQGRFGDSDPVDPERLKRMEERMLQNPDIKAAYEKRLKEDPDMKDNPEKKMAFFREMFSQMRGGRRRGS